MKDHFSSIVDEKFTAQMEEQSRPGGRGKAAWVKTLEEFYGGSAKSSLEDAERIWKAPT